MGIMAAIIFAVAIARQGILNPKVFQIRHVYALYASVAEIVIFLFAAKALGDDFQYGTTTQLFDNAYPRYQVLLSKLLSIIMLGLSLGIISSIIGTVAKPLMGVNQTWVEMIADASMVWWIYFLVSFSVGSFVLLVTIWCQNTTTSLIACIACFWIAPKAIQFVIYKWGENLTVSLIASSLPFYTASNKLTQVSAGTNEMIGLLLGGLVFTMIATFVLGRKDLK